MIELTNLSFAGFLDANQFVLVHFWAPWNGHDAKMKIILESVASEVADVAFACLCTDLPDHFELIRKYEVVGLPTLCLFRNGKLFKKMMGLASAQVIIQKLSELKASSLESSLPPAATPSPD